MALEQVIGQNQRRTGGVWITQMLADEQLFPHNRSAGAFRELRIGLPESTQWIAVELLRGMAEFKIP